LKRFERLLDGYSKDKIYFVRDDIIRADLIVYTSLENLSEIDTKENLLNKYSKLKQNREEISKQLKIVNYLKPRSQISQYIVIIFKNFDQFFFFVVVITVSFDTVEIISKFATSHIFEIKSKYCVAGLNSFLTLDEYYFINCRSI